MAQPSVAREPSMEEILASIRRIIESNEVDGARPTAQYQEDDGLRSDGFDIDTSALSAEPEEEIHLTIEDQLPSFAPDIRPVPERMSPAYAPQEPQGRSQPQYQPTAAPVPAARLSQPEPRNTAPEIANQQPDVRPAPAEEPRSISLADVAARVRAASERTASDQGRHVAANQGVSGQPAQSAPGASPVSAGRSVELRPSPQARVVEQAQVRVAEAPQAQPEPAMPEPVVTEAPRPVAAAEPQLPSLDLNFEPQRSEPARASTMPARPVGLNADSDFAVAEPVSAAVHVDQRTQPVIEPRVDAPMQAFAADVSRLVSEEATQAVIEDAKALVSSSTGDQVARSFKELADLVNSTPQRSLDEVAEQLLRPMLQEWLDDNLPTLVERLVREEIERVARGPRR